MRLINNGQEDWVKFNRGPVLSKEPAPRGGFPKMTDLSRITSRLSVAGFSGLISELSAGPLTEKREYAFRTLAPAKAVMALLYKWMTYRPDVKQRTTLRLDLGTATLTVLPRSVREKRGRKPNVY